MAKFDEAAGIMYMNVNECNRLSIIIIGDPLLPYHGRYTATATVWIVNDGIYETVTEDSQMFWPKISKSAVAKIWDIFSRSCT